MGRTYRCVCGVCLVVRDLSKDELSVMDEGEGDSMKDEDEGDSVKDEGEGDSVKDEG